MASKAGSPEKTWEARYTRLLLQLRSFYDGKSNWDSACRTARVTAHFPLTG